MKMNKTFVAALAAVTLVSCNKDDLTTGGNLSEDSKVVALSVSNQTLTRAMTEAVEADSEVEFEGGYIVFTDAGDRITNVFQLVNDDTHPDIAKPGSNAAADTLDTDNGLVILIEDLEDNYFFRVNSDAAQVHVFGNTAKHNLVFNANSKGQIDTYLSNFMVTANGLTDGAAGTVKNVPLYGVGPIQNYPDLSGTDKGNYSGEVERVAAVEIKPIASRLELAKMTAEPYTEGADTYTITDYKVEGVFLNYFHTGMAYTGKMSTSNGFVAFNSMDDFEENATSGSTAPWYTYANRHKFYDFDELTGIATYAHPSATPNFTVVSPAKAVWAYNMFQAQTLSTQEPQDALPHIVLKLTGVKVNKGSNPDPDFDENAYYYITIRRYTEQGTSNEVSAFEGGIVYHIEDLKFNAGNLKDVPEWREPIVAEVMFKVMKWQTKSVIIDLD